MSKHKPHLVCPNDPAHKPVHLMRYDSFMCPMCDVWTEPVCGCEPGTCEFKDANRPERPSQARP